MSINTELVIGVLASLYIAWGIGANDETMAMAASGSNWSIDRIAIFGAIFALVGAAMFGYSVEKTIGTGLLLIESSQRTDLIIIISTAIWLTAASWFGWPVSTTHTAVGAVIGVGFMSGGLSTINWSKFSSVSVGWVLSPFIGFLFSWIACRITRKFIEVDEQEKKMSRNWIFLTFATALMTEFWRGANDVGNATAFMGSGLPSYLPPRLIGGIGMAVGLIVLGRRVISAVGTQITRLTPRSAFITQAMTVVLIAIGTLLGLPLSGTHILVGALWGAGVATKRKVNTKMILYSGVVWIFTFPAATLFSMAFTYISSFF